MSLAILARKTREKHKLKRRGGFVLNMTAKQRCYGDNKCCTYPRGGVPAPQMGYGVYLSRKSNGASRPAGVRCCNGKSKTTFKILTANTSSDIIREKKDSTIVCYDASQNCTNQTTSCGLLKNICGCSSTDRVSYLRINHPKCNATKDICLSHSAGDQVIKKRGQATCQKKGELKISKPAFRKC